MTTAPPANLLKTRALTHGVTLGFGLLVLAVLVFCVPLVGGLGAGAIIVACIATAVSFWALGQYDAIWHRMAGVTTRPGHAQTVGMAAIAIGQTVGASSLTSALVRRGALTDLPHRKIAQISAGVALSFTACWSLLAILALGMGDDIRAFDAPAPFLIAALAFGIVIALVRLARQRLIQLPDACRLIGWTALDLSAAALALFVLLPDTMDVGFVAFWAVFVLAIGAGILSHLPCGIGVFEAVLIACLPATDLGPLLASLLLFRLVYYALPFALATRWLLALRRSPLTARVVGEVPPSAPAAWGLAGQSGAILSTQAGAMHVVTTPLGLVSLGDPLGARIETLRGLAGQAGRFAAAYKCSARLATDLRSTGWTTALIAKEAVLNPRTWTTAGRACQTLRRKIRHAQSNDVQVIHATHPLPLDQMRAIADDWAAAHDGEMGFSMGRFCPDYVTRLEVFLIYQGTTLCGFVTFHRGPHDWSLDLMRHRGQMPDGAMHYAIATAIAAAGSYGATRLSLAAVPVLEGPLALLCRGRTGLCQFKRSFAPRWEPLYHAAPSPLAFWVTGIGVIWEIQRPVARGLQKAGQTPLMRAIGRVWELSFGVRRDRSLGDPIAAIGPAPAAPQPQRQPHDKPLVPAA